jgi:hypothetical protein
VLVNEDVVTAKAGSELGFYLGSKIVQIRCNKADWMELVVCGLCEREDGPVVGAGHGKA